MKKIGKIIKNRRLELKLSQRELAKKVGVSHSTISRIESDQVIPMNDTIKGLSNALSLDYNYLLAKNDQIIDDPLVRIVERGIRKMDRCERDNFYTVISTFFPDIFNRDIGDVKRREK